jgi:hypothetical protein
MLSLFYVLFIEGKQRQVLIFYENVQTVAWKLP